MTDEQVPLREYVEAEIRHLREMMAHTAETSDRALSTALLASEKRLDALNELRGLASDQSARFATREKVESVEQAFNDKNGAQYALFDARIKALETRGSGQAGWMAGVAATIAILLAILGLLFRFITSGKT